MRSLRAYRKVVAFCFLALLLSLASLAPGSPIENRDFSHIDPSAYRGFNAFLIILGLAGFVSIYFIWRGSRGAYWAAIVIGWLNIIVVVSELARVFPVSSDPPGLSLGMAMVLDAILAFYVIVFSHKALGHI